MAVVVPLGACNAGREHVGFWGGALRYLRLCSGVMSCVSVANRCRHDVAYILTLLIACLRFPTSAGMEQM